MVMEEVLNFNEEQASKIREYFFKTQYNKDLQQEFDGFLTNISPRLRIKVQEVIFTKNLVTNRLIYKMINKVYKDQQKFDHYDRGDNVDLDANTSTRI